MKYPKAEQYHLTFTQVPSASGPYPIVRCGIDDKGNSQNIELAEFINEGGARSAKEVIDEVNGFNFDETSENNFICEIYSYYGNYEAEIYASPNRASFWNGTDYTNIPIQDFLEILQEWIDFLNAIPMVHSLSGR